MQYLLSLVAVKNVKRVKVVLLSSLSFPEAMTIRNTALIFH